MDYGPETFIARMPDASMEPRFREGDYLFVDPDEWAQPGRYVAAGGGEVGPTTVRLLVVEDGRRVLRALNPGWPEWTLDSRNETVIQGVVVFAGWRP